ncbi:unnamed protein product, partial [Nesidiocoris tenuis]
MRISSRTRTSFQNVVIRLPTVQSNAGLKSIRRMNVIEPSSSHKSKWAHQKAVKTLSNFSNRGGRGGSERLAWKCQVLSKFWLNEVVDLGQTNIFYLANFFMKLKTMGEIFIFALHVHPRAPNSNIEGLGMTNELFWKADTERKDLLRSQNPRTLAGIEPDIP